jgi:hypothetical protein
MENREAIEYINWMRDKFITNKPLEACDLAISALKKQEQDSNKCCETCKHKNRPVEESPCCDCYMSTAFDDLYETYTEEES